MVGNNDELVEPIDIQLRAAFIPRLGKRRVNYFTKDTINRAINEGIINGGEYNKKFYHKYVLIPGLGYIDAEAAANYVLGQRQQYDEDNTSEAAAQQSLLIRSLLENAKRAIPYTPRIGRAVFAPRIGKKATFVPRIG